MASHTKAVDKSNKLEPVARAAVDKPKVGGNVQRTGVRKFSNSSASFNTKKEVTRSSRSLSKELIRSGKVQQRSSTKRFLQARGESPGSRASVQTPFIYAKIDQRETCSIASKSKNEAIVRSRLARPRDKSNSSGQASKDNVRHKDDPRSQSRPASSTSNDARDEESRWLPKSLSQTPIPPSKDESSGYLVLNHGTVSDDHSVGSKSSARSFPFNRATASSAWDPPPQNFYRSESDRSFVDSFGRRIPSLERHKRGYKSKSSSKKTSTPPGQETKSMRPKQSSLKLSQDRRAGMGGSSTAKMIRQHSKPGSIIGSPPSKHQKPDESSAQAKATISSSWRRAHGENKDDRDAALSTTTSHQRIVENDAMATLETSATTASLNKSQQQLNSSLTQQQLNSSPTQQQLNSSPTQQQLNSSPTQQQLNSSPTQQQLNSSPTQQQLNSSPTQQQLNSSPTQQQLNSSPTQQQLNSSPTQQRLNSSPTQQQLNSSPTQQQLNSSPTQQQLNYSPAQQQLNYLPTQQQLNYLPTQQQLNSSPTQQQLNSSPTQQQLNSSPTQQQLNSSPTEQQLDSSPSQNQQHIYKEEWFSCDVATSTCSYRPAPSQRLPVYISRQDQTTSGDLCSSLWLWFLAVMGLGREASLPEILKFLLVKIITMWFLSTFFRCLREQMLHHYWHYNRPHHLELLPVNPR